MPSNYKKGGMMTEHLSQRDIEKKMRHDEFMELWNSLQFERTKDKVKFFAMASNSSENAVFCWSGKASRRVVKQKTLALLKSEVNMFRDFLSSLEVSVVNKINWGEKVGKPITTINEMKQFIKDSKKNKTT
jgi:hypothetical protein